MIQIKKYKQMKTITAILGICVLLISCNQVSKEEQEFDKIMQHVIDVHDEVMPKMGELSTLIKKMEPKIDTTLTGKQFAEAQKGLKNSYDFMMDWMSDFSNKFPHGEEVTSDNKATFDKKFQLLQEEKKEVDLLKEQINNSIQNAKKLLANTSVEQ